MEMFIRKPGAEVFPGVFVERGTVLSYRNERVEQELRDLVLVTVARRVGDGFVSEQRTTIELKEGDILVFEDGLRGYIKPAEELVTVDAGIRELNDLRAMGVVT